MQGLSSQIIPNGTYSKFFAFSPHSNENEYEKWLNSPFQLKLPFFSVPPGANGAYTSATDGLQWHRPTIAHTQNSLILMRAELCQDEQERGGHCLRERNRCSENKFQAKYPISRNIKNRNFF